MRFNFPHFLAFVWALLISFLIILKMYGCSTKHHSYKSQKHTKHIIDFKIYNAETSYSIISKNLYN
jgi:hypothetical protein